MRSQIRVTLQFVAILSLFVAGHCLAQDPAEPQSNDDLRREVSELRTAVAELTKRLEAFEYQAIPRAEIKSPQLAEPPSSSPSYVLPLAQPESFPAAALYSPKVITRPMPPLPTYLRFSEQIERAMMGPF